MENIEFKVRRILEKELETEFKLSLIPWLSTEDKLVFRLSYPCGGYDHLEVGAEVMRLVDPTTGKVYHAWALPFKGDD